MSIITIAGGDGRPARPAADTSVPRIADEQDFQDRAAAERVRASTTRRSTNEDTLVVGGIETVNEPDRIARRLDRLVRYHLDGTAEGAVPGSRVDIEDTLGRLDDLTGDADSIGKAVEAVINTADWLGVRYLDAGVAAARSVGRINIRQGRGFGTGFLVTPTLLMTNHHVLPDAEVAKASVVEFDYQDDMDGRERPMQTFSLDPDTFFVSDRTLDFALTAVRGTADALRTFGVNRLTEAQGTIVIGEFTTIVQHPRGDKKMVSLRENKLVDILESFVHYSADTEPGSSGSPVFNDQWEVVALHHASVRAPNRPEFGGVVNEGTRISRIIAFLRRQEYGPAQRALVEPVIGAAAAEARAAPAPTPLPERTNSAVREIVSSACGRITVTVTVDGLPHQLDHPDQREEER
ncbi:trypsin-like serine peptidase [Gordonia westfalica]|uniref:Serine protease n=1 Tax=Gordonia westfalica TaxID=158898 RepID=A0A1H2HC15_9ACTN|nr:serine protease [Gordonia westfalica]SDU29437.1 V8-like Glu-specific endopeptidase [Gordonia westfalica]